MLYGRCRSSITCLKNVAWKKLRKKWEINKIKKRKAVKNKNLPLTAFPSHIYSNDSPFIILKHKKALTI